MNGNSAWRFQLAPGLSSGKLTAVPQMPAEKPELRSLRGIYRGILPHATYEDFQEIKKVWEPRPLTE